MIVRLLQSSDVVETDICIVGAGITAAMVAERLAERTAADIVVVEAGAEIFNLGERFDRRARFLAYGENPWPDDHIRGQSARNIQSRSMAVGGLALHWGGVTPRFTPEDFRLRSAYGVGTDWPLVGMKSYRRFFDSLELSDDEREAIGWKTAARLFKIDVDALAGRTVPSVS